MAKDGKPPPKEKMISVVKSKPRDHDDDFDPEFPIRIGDSGGLRRKRPQPSKAAPHVKTISLLDDDISDDEKDFEPKKKPKISSQPEKRSNSSDNLTQKTLNWGTRGGGFNFGPSPQASGEPRGSQPSRTVLSQGIRATDEERMFSQPLKATIQEKTITQDTLAVQPKKVEEVRKWLKKCDYVTPSILLLVGPAGCGKTTTLEVVTRELGVEIVEWINPVDQIFSQKISSDTMELEKDFEGYVPKMQKFIRFVSKSTKFSSLRFEGEDPLPAQLSQNPKKVILFEDYPNLEHYETKVQYQNCLRDYMSSRTPSVPIVLLVSDVFTSHSDLRMICPDDLMSSIHRIDFNPIATNLLVKALKRISFQISPDLDSKLLNEAIDAIARNSNGDVRCAVNCLRFFLSKRFAPKVKPEDVTFAGTLGRDCSVNLFHAVGKMAYSKRLPPTAEYFETNCLPPHMSRLERHPMKSEPEGVVSSLHTEASTFNLFVHQNYLNFFKEAGEVATAAAYASDADLFPANFQESERMSEYATSVFCRGMLFAREDQSTPAHSNLFKPEWFTVNKNAKENQAQLDDLYGSYLEGFIASPKCYGSPLSKNVFLREVLPTAKAIFNSKERQIPDFIRKHNKIITILSRFTNQRMTSIYSGRQKLDENEQEGVGDKFDDDETAPKPDQDSLAAAAPRTREKSDEGDRSLLPDAKLIATIEKKLFLVDDDIED